MKNKIFKLLAIGLLLGPILTHAQAVRDVPLDTVATAVDADIDFIPKGYYTFRPDYRLCPSPVCGGVYVKEVNRLLTRCADGSLQEECYVATMRWKTLGFDPKTDVDARPVLLRGKIRKRDYPNFGNLGIFVVKQAYRAVGQPLEDMHFVGLEDNGIVCITSPCFSVNEYTLNIRTETLLISGVDLSQTGTSQRDLKIAHAILANSVLLSAGENVVVQETIGPGITFKASQFFIPLGAQ